MALKHDVESTHPLDLSGFAPIFVVPTHLGSEELYDIEVQLVNCKAPLTYDALEARLFLSKVKQKRRAVFELRSRKLCTREFIESRDSKKDSTPSKRRRLSVISTTVDFSKAPDELNSKSVPDYAPSTPNSSPAPKTLESNHTVQFVKLEWFESSRRAGTLLPIDDFLVYKGELFTESLRSTTSIGLREDLPIDNKSREIAQSVVDDVPRPSNAPNDILARAQQDSPSTHQSKHVKGRLGQRGDPRFNDRVFSASSQVPRLHSGSRAAARTRIFSQETSGNEDESNDSLPEMPDWVRSGRTYSCERATPYDSPNRAFAKELHKIKLARLLTADHIGVRAYSSSIAAVLAYPYTLTSPREILAIPGCDVKIVNLWIEWKNSGGHIRAAEEAENDETLKVLRLFYDIWGVGDTTAREFYFDRGWRDLEDIVEYGWHTLTRVQQIGVKFYNEFLQKIPRSEVEFIADTIRKHAIKLKGEGVETCIVGGYRRGKEESGDVDVIVSHRDESKSLGIVRDIVASLEEEGWITHTLLISLNNTNRGQSTLPFRTGRGGGHGFDTLDKALVVWQDPSWPGKESADSEAKNPNIHRRVDIIVSPWRTVGCAVMGWSGETTFQRDLRRYAKNLKQWKFDSSGIRDRTTGQVMHLEGIDVEKRSCEQAERRVFEGLGLQWREPWERCTG